jgi:hypothetical protein
MKNDFQLLDEQSAQDLQAYLTRAKKMDPKGAVRLRAFGTILTAYVAPLFTGNILDDGPTVLGLRTMELKSETELNILVPIQAVLDRLAFEFEKPEEVDRFRFQMQSTERVAWAGVSPPRTGWLEAGTLPEHILTNVAKKESLKLPRQFPSQWAVQSQREFGPRFGEEQLIFIRKCQPELLSQPPGWDF